MKGKKTKALYIIFFVAAVFFAAFVLAEFRKDYLSIALAGIVMLIAAYFLVDKIERDVYEKYELDKQDINQKFEETSETIQRGYDRIEQLQQAIVNASMQGLSDPQESFTKLLSQLEEVEQILTSKKGDGTGKSEDDQLQKLCDGQQEMIALLKKGFKAIIQFSKENARQVALNTNENTEKLLSQIEKDLTELKEELPKLVQQSNGEVSERLEELEKLTDEVHRIIEKGDVA